MLTSDLAVLGYTWPPRPYSIKPLRHCYVRPLKDHPGIVVLGHSKLMSQAIHGPIFGLKFTSDEIMSTNVVWEKIIKKPAWKLIFKKF